jgi:CheY-like chemotaxis protein
MQSRKKIVKSRRSSSLRILHVDDDDNQLFFTKLFLERCNPNLSVESLLTPSAVANVLLEKKYDCIVSDYQMEEMDGVDLTRKIRLVSDVPIIISGRERGDSSLHELGPMAMCRKCRSHAQGSICPDMYVVRDK